MKIVILLTACINPNGMPYTVINSVEERRSQYIKALDFYLNNTKLPIVFCENSNADISKSYFKQISSKRLEILTFDGNNDKTHGKGYGEAEIIEYAINHSTMIYKNTCLVKITGRLILNNIKSLVRQLNLGILPKSSIICSFNSDFVTADSRLIIAPCNFYKMFLKNKDKIDDNRGVYFEHVLSRTIKEQRVYSFFPFISEPQIIGISGSTGTEYKIPETSSEYKMRYVYYRLSQQILLTKENGLKPLNSIRIISLRFTSFVFMQINKIYRQY